MSTTPIVISKWLETAGNSICCLRCTALSKRTKAQCGRPALRSSSTQKCQFHGGRGSGPKTDIGRAAVSRSHLIHGDDTNSRRLERAEKKLWFAHIEDIMHVLAMTSMSRQRGRKPLGYKKISTLDQAIAFIKLNNALD
jgi:hypothetical protein